jgi:methionyl-tRNA formyltransferase
MKIVFMGTPDFAVPSLQSLLNSRHSAEAVVTVPDKEKGRGLKVAYSPVKEFALKNNIEVLQPVSLKEDSFISRLKEINADLFIIVAFRILPKEVYMLPLKGSFNLHGSLLPKYRGAAPIQWALIKGEKETGVTTFFLKDKVDTGNIIMQEKIEIFEDDNFGTLHDRMSLMGAEVVLKTVELIDSGNITPVTQNDELATPAPKITKETAIIDFTKPAREIHNLVRGLSPYPAAYFHHNNKIIKVYKTKIVKGETLTPGTFRQTKTEAITGCGEDALSLLEVQQEGRKRLGIEEFLRGYSFV